MEFNYINDYYRTTVRSRIISKNNILNTFKVVPFKQVNITISLKRYKKSCVLIIFWLLFSLIGQKPLIIKFSSFKKKKIKFVITLNFNNFNKVIRTLTYFVFSNYEKKQTITLIRSLKDLTFFLRNSYLESIETLPFYKFINVSEMGHLLENLYLVFNFKKCDFISTIFFLQNMQLPLRLRN